MHQTRHDADFYQRVEVITGLRRRRDWSDAEKARILAESADPEVNISEVARRNGQPGIAQCVAAQGAARFQRRTAVRAGQARRRFRGSARRGR